MPNIRKGAFPYAVRCSALQAALASPFGRGGRAKRGRRGKTMTIPKDNSQLENARRLRREMTPHERKLWHVTRNVPHICHLWVWIFYDFPTGRLTGIFAVCANKLTLPFKTDCRTLSVTCGDSSPKGRAKLPASKCMDTKTERIGSDTLH